MVLHASQYQALVCRTHASALHASLAHTALKPLTPVRTTSARTAVPVPSTPMTVKPTPAHVHSAIPGNSVKSSSIHATITCVKMVPSASLLAPSAPSTSVLAQVASQGLTARTLETRALDHPVRTTASALP
ncbi:uncharacterized protein [Diadema setosum]|uniref:uncharacterized protein n=1 Tax=Diadema setosum TaxID=31175 RepID=UPI003B3AC7DC